MGQRRKLWPDMPVIFTVIIIIIIIRCWFALSSRGGVGEKKKNSHYIVCYPATHSEKPYSKLVRKRSWSTKGLDPDPPHVYLLEGVLLTGRGEGGLGRPGSYQPYYLVPTYLHTGYLGTYLPTTGYLGTYLPTYIPETCKPHTTIDEHHYQPDLSVLSFPPLFLPSPVFPRTLTSAAPIVMMVFTERGSRSEGARQQSIGVDTYYRHTHTAPSL